MEINVTCGRHDDDELPLLCEGQGAVADLATRDDEVELRTEHILAQIVDLDKVSCHNGNLGL